MAEVLMFKRPSDLSDMEIGAEIDRISTIMRNMGYDFSVRASLEGGDADIYYEVKVSCDKRIYGRELICIARHHKSMHHAFLEALKKYQSRALAIDFTPPPSAA